MNVGKYYIDIKNCTEEENKWIRNMHKKVGKYTIHLNCERYYLFKDFEFVNYSKIPFNYPLYTVKELKEMLNKENIYECW